MLVPLYRQATDMAPDKGDEMRVLIRGYAAAVVGDAWASLEKNGQPSETARRITGQIVRTFGTLPGSVDPVQRHRPGELDV
jgi:hypothetical protein